MGLKNIKITLLFLCVIICLSTSCGEEGVKIDRADRFFIDTTANKEINKVSVEMDKWCKDSSDFLVKKLTDSLVIVREQEIMQKMLPVH